MPLTDASRVEIQEGSTTHKERYLDTYLVELDRRINYANLFLKFFRTNNLISKIEYFSDAALTKKIMEKSFSRVSGVGNVALVSTIVTTFYNDDNTIDAQVSGVITRNLGAATNDVISACSGHYLTSESTKL